MVLRLDRDGMFWNVNRVLNTLNLAVPQGRDFRVRWRNSVYSEPGKGRSNTWLSYFFQVFENARDGRNPEKFSRRNFTDNGQKERLMGDKYRIGGKAFGLKLPEDRHLANALIENHIRLRPEVQALISDFLAKQFRGPVIGAHIRGRGRSQAGGVGLMRHLLDPDEPIPYKAYFAAINRALARYPEARILACSDSFEVLDRCRQHYGDRVFSYGATRSAFGEMHCTAEPDDAAGISPHKLGLDILVEAYALASCDAFVHGNSNVSNFVLCKTPDMPSEYVYQPVLGEYLEIERKRGQTGTYEGLQPPSEMLNPKEGLTRFRTSAERIAKLGDTMEIRRGGGFRFLRLFRK